MASSRALIFVVAELHVLCTFFSLATRYKNCYDMLADSVHGVPWPEQQQHTGDRWGNGYRCRGSGEPLSDSSQFCTARGWTCAAYEAKAWCFDGYPNPATMRWATGPGLLEPEKACCVCGGGLCVSGEDCWQTLAGLAADQGHDVGSLGFHRWHSLQDCKRLCNKMPECNSFAYSVFAGGFCQLKDRCISADTDVVPNVKQTPYLFHTYYKRCEAPVSSSALAKGSSGTTTPMDSTDLTTQNDSTTLLPVDGQPGSQLHQSSVDDLPNPPISDVFASDAENTNSIMPVWSAIVTVVFVAFIGLLIAVYGALAWTQQTTSTRFVVMAEGTADDEEVEDDSDVDAEGFAVCELTIDHEVAARELTLPSEDAQLPPPIVQRIEPHSWFWIYPPLWNSWAIRT